MAELIRVPLEAGRIADRRDRLQRRRGRQSRLLSPGRGERHPDAGGRNQAPLLRGINDDPDEIAALFGTLADAGVTPYYLFHCRPTFGNEAFMMSLQEGLRIVVQARRRLSGLGKRFRYVASHASGKIEIVGQVGNDLILRYHEARQPEDEGRLLAWPAGRPLLWPDEAVAACQGS
jgi:hypothetical protein